MITSAWQFWALLSAIFAALTAIFAKVGISGINSDFATLVRTIVIIAALCLFLSVTGLAYFRALQLGDASHVAPIDKLSVIFVAIFGVTFLGEKLSAINWAGVVLIGAGVIMLSLKM